MRDYGGRYFYFVQFVLISAEISYFPPCQELEGTDLSSNVDKCRKCLMNSNYLTRYLFFTLVK